MDFNTVNLYCNVIPGFKDNGNNTDILYTFNLIEPPVYMMHIKSNNKLQLNLHIKSNNKDQLPLIVTY